MPTLRHTRYQAGVVHNDELLLVRCAFADGRTVWMLPGGGREADEGEAECVAREVVEETGLTVRVERLLSDVAAEPPDGMYTRWRTYECAVISGNAAPGGGEGPNAELIAIQWLALGGDAWPADVVNDRFLYPQLVAIRAAIRK